MPVSRLRRISSPPENRGPIPPIANKKQPSPETIMKHLILKFLEKNESGATAIEYGLIAAGIAIVIITAVNGVGPRSRQAPPLPASR